MATKDEYYHKIIASQQTEITSLKTSVAELNREFNSLKASVSEILKTNNHPRQEEYKKEKSDITVQAILTKIGDVFQDAIKGHIYKMKDRFVEKKDFVEYSKSAEQKFLSAETFTAYQRSQEKRLKSIEDKLGSHYSFLTINRHEKGSNHKRKSYFNFDTLIKVIKNGNLQWIKPIIVCLSICLLALYLISTITS